MNDATAKMERHDRVLAELSELGLTLARELHGRAVAAGTAGEAQALSLAFHRISRSVRQTIALEAKLDRERLRQDHDARREGERRADGAAMRRRSQVRLAVERTIWTEAEGLEAERLLSDLDDALEEAALADGFLDGPVEAMIARIRDDLGLAASPADEGADEGAGEGDPALPPGPIPRVAGVNST